MKKALVLAIILSVLCVLSCAAEEQNEMLFSTNNDPAEALSLYCDYSALHIQQERNNENMAVAIVKDNNGKQHLIVAEKNAAGQTGVIDNPSILPDKDLALILEGNTVFWEFDDEFLSSDAYAQPIPFHFVFHATHEETGWRLTIDCNQQHQNVTMTVMDDMLLVSNQSQYEEEGLAVLPIEGLSSSVDLSCFNLNDIYPYLMIECSYYSSHSESKELLKQIAERLLPGSTMVSGCLLPDGIQLLMENSQGQRYFAGIAVSSNDNRKYVVTTGTVFPEGTRLGNENFTDSFYNPGILFVDLCPSSVDGKDNWSINVLWDIEDTLYNYISVREHFIRFYTFTENEPDACKTVYGKNPWMNITKIDWNHIPKNSDEAVDAMDLTDMAITRCTDASAQIILYDDPKNPTYSCVLYSNAPAHILSIQGEWTEIEICGTLQGWIKDTYLAKGKDMLKVFPAANLEDVRYVNEGEPVYAYDYPSKETTEIIVPHSKYLLIGEYEELSCVYSSELYQIFWVKTNDINSGNG